ncbi:MAG: hypothetical protein KDC87_09240, partial [Planctomycetes bacterium]|nr:hypothetical protein [Planctomycetota bacterium]
MNPSTHASLVLSLLALSASASAQLSGSYTVGPSGNYSTLAAASAALSTSGVNGPVEMVLSAGGTYTESWSLSPIPGTSATNTVTFRSAVTNINTLKAKLVATAGDLLTINGGVDWLILDGLNFQTVSGASAINCLRNGTPAVAVTNLTIRNCVFGQGVVPNASYGAIRTQSINTWWLLDNEFDLNGTAVYSQGSINMEIARNVFTSNSPYCLSIWNSNKSQSRMHNNVFLGTITSACIRINLSHYGTDIFHNTFNLLIPSGSGVAVYNSSCCAVWNRYFNNIFAISGSGYAINHLNQKDIEINNNLYWTASKVIGSYNNTTYNTLAAWGAALGTYAQNGNNDNNSIVADPLFKPATSFELLPASPAVGKALPQPASWTAGHEVLDDLRGYMRGNKKDIGA